MASREQQLIGERDEVNSLAEEHIDECGPCSTGFACAIGTIYAELYVAYRDATGHAVRTSLSVFPERRMRT